MLREMPKSKKRITIVGAGNVARALLAALPKAGYKVDEVIARERSSRQKVIKPLAKSVGAKVVTPERATFEAETTWLLVNDSAIRSCAEQIAERGNWKGKVVLHASGALSSDELKVMGERGASVGSAHPMMTFVQGAKPALKGIAWSVEGDAKAVRRAKEIVGRLGGKPFQLPKEDKALYHAFGAFLSPLLVVQLDTAAKVGKRAGIAKRDLARFMEPIVHRTLENFFANIGKKGSGPAFSGPLVRGDVNTIARHLDSLKEVPQARELYIALLNSALASDLPVQNREQIRTLVHNSQ